MASPTTLHIGPPCHMRCAPMALDGLFPALWARELCLGHTPLGSCGALGSTPTLHLSPMAAPATSSAALLPTGRVGVALGVPCACSGRTHSPGFVPRPRSAWHMDRSRLHPSACSRDAGPPKPYSLSPHYAHYLLHCAWLCPLLCLYLSPYAQLPLPLPLPPSPRAHRPCLNPMPPPLHHLGHARRQGGREGGREAGRDGVHDTSANWPAMPYEMHTQCPRWTFTSFSFGDASHQRRRATPHSSRKVLLARYVASPTALNGLPSSPHLALLAVVA